MLARPKRVDPDLLKLDPGAMVHHRTDFCGRKITVMCSASVCIEMIEKTIERQAKGYYTMGEVAQILADAYSLDSFELLKRMVADYDAGNLTVRSDHTDAPLLPNAQLSASHCWMFPGDIDAMVKHWGWDRSFPTAASTTASQSVPVVAASETREQRQDRRLAACEAAGLLMPQSSAGRLPNGVGRVADTEGVTRQAFSIDVKAGLKRRESAKSEGRTVHRP